MGRTWIKSSRSGGNSGNCVEVAMGEAVVPVRDSKRADNGPVIEFTRPAFASFLADVRVGRGLPA
ncbi:DUF397 domain-containing protein [Streptomyces sp. DSM 41982]|uniref:DUF397 domain-containing protein n=1 Tax=Streptomyces evansiae TaxID=3075535 RepID=A0ABD5E8P7_9ACTN|nr:MULTISPECIES: DUF397 domain-containing protein [unclassified Streptomyces]MDT0417779.1 DUF397 domain-containing protein [Streptomyces sp. DSM 41982]SCD67301.1 protein of unknown function [Streptomyces sp. SolWspMP-sol7th]